MRKIPNHQRLIEIQGEQIIFTDEFLQNYREGNQGIFEYMSELEKAIDSN